MADDSLRAGRVRRLLKDLRPGSMTITVGVDGSGPSAPQEEDGGEEEDLFPAAPTDPTAPPKKKRKKRDEDLEVARPVPMG